MDSVLPQKLSPHVPKFGNWDMDGDEAESQNFTMVFDTVRANRGMKNDPTGTATVLNSSSSTSSSSTQQALAHRRQPPPSVPQSAPSPTTAVAGQPVTQKMQSSHIPKFGDWDADEVHGEQQPYTLIFNNVRANKSTTKIDPNDPAFLASFSNNSSLASSSASSQSTSVFDAEARPSSHQSVSPSVPQSKLPMSHKMQSSHIPKFGDWDADKEHGEQQPYTLIFDNMRVNKSPTKIDPNDPAFLASFYNNSSLTSSSSSQSTSVFDVKAQPSSHESVSPSMTQSKLPMSQKMQSSHVPKFGDWDADKEHGEQQPYTLIFDNMRANKSTTKIDPNDPAFIASFFNNSSLTSSSSSQSTSVFDAEARPSSHESVSSSMPQSKLPMSQKHTTAPKFGDWDAAEHQEYTVMFDCLKEEKQNGGRSVQRTEKRTTPTRQKPPLVAGHKPSLLLNWRQCFSSSHAVKE